VNGDGPTELDWGAERRSLAADDRDELAAQRDRLAYGRDADAEQRQRAAETRSGWPAADAGGAPEAGWEYREEARLARKHAAEQRAQAARSRQQAEAARRALRTQYPLAARFTELAEHLFAAGSMDEVLSRIVEASVEVIDGADLAGVSLFAARGGISTPAYTDALALRLDELQYDTGEGPCRDINGDAALPYLVVSDVASYPGWPTFGPLAGRLGIHAVLSLGLFPRSPAADGSNGATVPGGGRRRLGTLNLYARERRAFDDDARDVGMLLAAHAAVAVAGTTQTSQLRDALDTRDVIGQAKGILMARRNLTADQAFDVLRRTSQNLNVKLRDLAVRIAETRAVPPLA